MLLRIVFIIAAADVLMALEESCLVLLKRVRNPLSYRIRKRNMNKRILVIDDDEAIRKSFCLALEDTGYLVDTAESGERGIFTLTMRKFDLIFLDLNMPGINGVETLRRLRQINPGVPVYIVTAYHEGFMNELKGAAEKGIKFEVLQKPIGYEEMISVSKSVLEHPMEVAYGEKDIYR